MFSQFSSPAGFPPGWTTVTPCMIYRPSQPVFSRPLNCCRYRSCEGYVLYVLFFSPYFMIYRRVISTYFLRHLVFPRRVVLIIRLGIVYVLCRQFSYTVDNFRHITLALCLSASSFVATSYHPPRLSIPNLPSFTTFPFLPLLHSFPPLPPISLHLSLSCL